MPLALALALHALGLLAISPWLTAAEQEVTTPKPPPKPRDDSPMIVRTVMAPPEPEPEPEPEPPLPEPEEPQPQEVMDLNRKVVAQKTNEERPEQADYLSQQDNRTKEQTRAEDTTMKEVLPGETVPPDLEDVGDPDPDPTPEDKREEAPEPPPQELAMATPRAATSPSPQPKPEVAPEQPDASEQLERSDDGARPMPDNASDDPVVQQQPKDKPQVDPRRLFGPPSMRDYDDAFSDRDPIPRAAPQTKNQRMFANIERRQRLLKASLENMIPEIQVGNHTSVNAHRAVYAGYIGTLHRKIHGRWADQYLSYLDTREPRSSPLQNPNLGVTLEFVIEAASGKFEAVNIVQSSGQLMFDAEAIDTAWAIGPRPNPPPQIISPNGKVYIHWRFWRDGRQCGAFGAEIFLVTRDADGRLIREKGTIDEAMKQGDIKR